MTPLVVEYVEKKRNSGRPAAGSVPHSPFFDHLNSYSTMNQVEKKIFHIKRIFSIEFLVGDRNETQKT